MIKNQLSKRWTRWKARLVPAAIGAGMLFSGLLPSIAHALFVDGPGRVLVIDGTDSGAGIVTFNIDATIQAEQYDFGFVNTSGFTPITLNPTGPASLFGSYTFQGGDIVDFALRDNSSGSIYSISDPARNASQIYLTPIDPSNSIHPPVSFTYYNTLVLQWDLDHNGLVDAGFTFTNAVNPNDGFAPAPVPLPAAFLLFGGGMAGLSIVRKRLTEVMG